jgi:putative ABC transport system substrate-binding protein
MRRREFVALVGGAAAGWPLAARAQQRKFARIGALVLTTADAQSLGRALREGLREFGYAEGQNFALEFRSADGNADRLPELAADLARLPVDVMVATFTPCALAAKQATTTIPIVMAAVADPVGAGLVQSLARPGGNITGFSNMAAETAGKSVELLRDMLPSLRRVAVLANPADPFTGPFLEQVHLAGRIASIEIAPVAMARANEEVDAAFATMAQERAEAVVVQVELPTKFELVINLKTAKALGIDVPWFLQQRADEVIE